MNKKIFFSSIIGGIIITLLTGLIPNIPAKPPPPGLSNLLGHPFFWLHKYTLPPDQPNPWQVNTTNLIADIIIWAIIIGVILFLVKRLKR